MPPTATPRPAMSPSAVTGAPAPAWARLARLQLVALCIGAAAAIAPTPSRAQGTAEASAATSGAMVTVQRLHDALIEVMRGGAELGYPGRYDRLAGEFDELFDVPYISRLLLGTQWRNLSRAQHERFQKLVFQYAAGTFASRFSSYEGERFDLEFEKPLQRTRMQVRGRFTGGDGETLQLDYALHKRRDSWQIVDVYYDGVSGTRIQRNEFVSIVEDQGIDALFEQLAGKIVLLEAGEE